MKVSHYFEFEEKVTGGIAESVKHQRKALEKEGIEYTEKPDLDSDILHLNLMGPRSVYYALRARRKGIPVVAHTHVTAEDFSGSFRFSNILSKPLKPYLSKAYSLADKLVCPSDYNRELISGYTDRQTEVVTNGVDTEKLEGFEDLREEYLERYDLEPPVVFCVGHVFRRKGLKDFIETARQKPEMDFAWFGPLELELKGRETKRMIKNSPDNCIFPGFIDDVRGAFAAGDVFFFPTYEENEGIALLEALSCGKSVVVRDIEVFDWLESGENALKTDEFREALEELKQKDRREYIGRNARELSENFSLDKVGERLLSVYRSV